MTQRKKVTLRRLPRIYTPDVVSRFFEKVERRGPDECWPWRGAIGGGGKTNRYGRFKVARWDTVGAHRAAWEIENGADLGDHFACHTCDNTICVNPRHIYAGDRASNTQDAIDRHRYIGRGNKRSRFAEPKGKPQHDS